MSELPRRRFVLECKIGADDFKELQHALDEVVRRLDEGVPIRCTTGGPAAGWNLDVTEDPSVTHESYFTAVQKLLSDEREQKDGQKEERE